MDDDVAGFLIWLLVLFFVTMIAFSRGYEVGAEAVARVVCEQQGLEWIDEYHENSGAFAKHPDATYGTWIEPDVTCIQPLERVTP